MKKQKQQSQYQGSQQQTNFGFEGDDYSDFFESMFAGQGGEQELQAIKDKILTLNYI
jgi:DnaJ-class molecular chaperone